MINVPLVTLLFIFVGSALGQLNSAATDGTTIGAVYTMSNSETNNQIIVNRLNSKGKLSYATTVSTGGNGQNSTLKTMAPIGRGAIQVYSNYLFAINQGSQTVSMFTINPSDATSLTLNATLSTSGQYPVSVTVSPTHACVLTRLYTAEISCFPYNSSGSQSSRITYNISGYLATTYPSGFGTPNQLLFSKDNSVLIATISGNSPLVPNRILFFQLKNGALVFLNDQLLNNSATINTMTLVGTNSLLVVSSLLTSGASFTQFINYSSTNASAMFTSISPLTQTSVSALFGTLYSPKTDNYYALDSSFRLLEFKLNLNASQYPPFSILSHYGALCSGYDPRDATIVTSGDTDYMFVVRSPSSEPISGYQFKAGSDPISNCYTAAQSTTNSNVMTGIAAYIQTSSSASVRTICIWIVFVSINLIHLI